MPKTRGRKKSARNGRNDARISGKNTPLHETRISGQVGVQARPAAGGLAGMIMPAMVALGCWGMAFTFTVFSTDSNRLLFGGMAALMALMWSISFGIRARKVLHQK